MRTKIIAHRGVSLGIPENTIPAFREAVRLGLDGVETDVQLTRDGRSVLHHNYTIDASSDGSGAVYSMDYDALRAYDFGSYVDERWKGTRIPNLEEFWQTVGEMPIVNIELKAPIDRTAPYVESVLDKLSSFEKTDNIIISAFDHSLLKRVKELRADLKVGLLTMPRSFTSTPLFTMLERSYPADKPLIDARSEDMTAVAPDAFDPHKAGLPGKDARDAVAELAHQIGAVYPGSTLDYAKAALGATVDLRSYVKGLGFKAEYLHCHYSDVLRDPTLVKDMADMGVLCNVWTPDKHEELKALLDSGCNAIITNRPDILKELEAGL